MAALHFPHAIHIVDLFHALTTPLYSYVDFTARGLFVGSGVVEAGCKSIIGARMKKSGAKWSVRGANGIIALRCTYSLITL
jgi:hypothetical protein